MDRTRARGTVQKAGVNRGVLIGVAAVAGAAIFALAYQLGRLSGSAEVPAPPARIERIAPRAPDRLLPPPARVAGAVTEPADARPGSAAAPDWRRVAPQEAPAQAAAPYEGGRGGGASDSTRAAVAAYFDALERVQVGSASGNAESVGQEMAAALASGDTSSLDKMIRETEAARAALAAVAPPAPCAAHHRESLASLDDALEVLRSLKAAMQSPEPLAQLANVTARAQTLRTRADALQKEEQALRARYGLRR